MKNKDFLIDVCCDIMNHLVDTGELSEDDQIEVIGMMKTLDDMKED